MQRLFLLVVLMLCLVLCACGENATSQVSVTPTPTATATPIPTEAPTQLPTPTPKPTNQHGDIGVSQISDVWIVTVNAISTSTGDEFDTPKPGDIYVLVNVTTQNTDSTNRLIAEGDFTFKDEQGNAYNSTILSSDQHNFLGGNVVAGQKLRGDLDYEIPKALHSFILQFDPNFDANLIVQWNLNV